MDLSDIAAVAATAVALAALVVAWLARRDSHRSAIAADASAKATEGALDLARSEALRAIERSDVEWTAHLPVFGIVAYRNVGSDTAYSATAVLTVNGDRLEFDWGDVKAGQEIRYESAEHIARVEEVFGQPIGIIEVGVGDSTLRPDWIGDFRVSARVSWTSKMGTPRVAEL